MEQLKSLIASNPYNSRHLSKTQKKTAVAMFLLGYRITDIAAIVGTQRHHIYNYLRHISNGRGLFTGDIIEYAMRNLLAQYIDKVE